MELVDRIPLVYRNKQPDAKGSAHSAQLVSGTRSSRDEAIRRLECDPKAKIVEVNALESTLFYYERGIQAKAAIRESLASASTAQIESFLKTLKVVEDRTEEYRKQGEVPSSYSQTPQRLVPVRAARFHNRAKEKETLGRFLESKLHKNILLLHGPPGIGKKELLGEVQRLSPDSQAWIRFRCTAESRLAETFAQLMVQLDRPGDVPDELNRHLYQSIFDAIVAQGMRVVVFEDAHRLPISSDNQDHIAFLDFLAYICSDEFRCGVRVIFVSNWRGHLHFSGSHRMETLPLEGLEREYVVEILQEHLVVNASRYRRPTIDELSTVASKLHGDPYFARIASVVLEECPASEVIEKLYSRIETREFVIGRLLGRIQLSEKEQRFLEFASILRLPVTSEAFSRFAGPVTTSLLQDLRNRFLLVSDGRTFKLHPVLSEFFASSIQNADHIRRFHTIAFENYDSISRRRTLTVEERIEYVYHGVSCGKYLDQGVLQMFAGSVRSALMEGVKNRDWAAVENAAGQLLLIWPNEPSAQVGMALAFEATGRAERAEQYSASLSHVTAESLWLGIEFVKNRMRRRDFDGAERGLAVLSHKFGSDLKVAIVQAQMAARRGETEKAVELCDTVLTNRSTRDAEAFLAGLILRDGNRLDILVNNIGTARLSDMRNSGLLSSSFHEKLYNRGSGHTTPVAPADPLRHRAFLASAPAAGAPLDAR